MGLSVTASRPEILREVCDSQCDARVVACQACHLRLHILLRSCAHELEHVPVRRVGKFHDDHCEAKRTRPGCPMVFTMLGAGA